MASSPNRAWLVMSLLSLSLACSSRYQPARSPHVARTVEDGRLVHVRDGTTYASGLDGGLSEAVQGNPRAEVEARAFVRKMYWGLGSVLGGLGLVAGGLAIAPHDEKEFRWNGRNTAAISLAGAGLAAYFVGLGFFISAAPHQFDATNIYNDDVDARLQAQFRQQLRAAVEAERLRLNAARATTANAPGAPAGGPSIAPAQSAPNPPPAVATPDGAPTAPDTVGPPEAK